MKKQYDVTKLTDELSKSVFFQEPDKAPKHQATKAPELQSALAPSNRTTEEIKQESTKALSNLSGKAPTLQRTKALKHFSSYLTPESYRAWKLLATQRERKDYEILQEAVEQYLEREGMKA